MSVLELLKREVVFLDGGMGTLLQAAGLQAGEHPELWNLSHPDVVQKLHRAYFDAGSHIVNINTFGANRLKFSSEELEEIVRACSDGLPMLVAQAKVAEEHFFEKSIPDSENERILTQLYRQTTNIVLIGMPGCGKSTVGQALSALSGREAIDMDARIADRAGCSIPEIFAQGGEAAFRALEREEAAAVGKLSGKIILTGGGVVKDEANYASLHQNGRIYHLMRDLHCLPTEGRPLSQNADLAAMWEQRKPLYARFRDAVIENSGTIEETAAAIWRDFCEHSGA